MSGITTGILIGVCLFFLPVEVFLLFIAGAIYFYGSLLPIFNEIPLTVTALTIFSVLLFWFVLPRSQTENQRKVYSLFAGLLWLMVLGKEKIAEGTFAFHNPLTTLTVLLPPLCFVALVLFSEIILPKRIRLVSEFLPAIQFAAFLLFWSFFQTRLFP
jgi:hypothetical protein